MTIPIECRLMMDRASQKLKTTLFSFCSQSFKCREDPSRRAKLDMTSQGLYRYRARQGRHFGSTSPQKPEGCNHSTSRSHRNESFFDFLHERGDRGTKSDGHCCFQIGHSAPLLALSPSQFQRLFDSNRGRADQPKYCSGQRYQPGDVMSCTGKSLACVAALGLLSVSVSRESNYDWTSAYRQTKHYFSDREGRELVLQKNAGIIGQNSHTNGKCQSTKKSRV